MKNVRKFVCLLILPALLFSCKSKNKTPNVEIVTEDVLDPTDILLSEKETTLAPGETYQIQAQFIKDTGEKLDVPFTYKSLNESVATVSDSGLVRAVSFGQTIIQVSYDKIKTLFKVTVEGSHESSLLGLTIFDNSISLYEEDAFTFRYEARLNSKIINLNAVYSDYNTSIISIENNVITALSVGTTNAKIKVTYGELEAEETFVVSVLETKYYLSCNYESNQVVVGESDLTVTYSLNYGSHQIENLSLSDMTCNVSNNEVATINGNALHGVKKGNFDLAVSYLIPGTSETVTSTDSFRTREKYTVKCIDFDEPIYVLNGDKISYIPTNSDPNLIFDSWLKDGTEFNEPVESNLRLGVKWKVNNFNFAQDVRGAKSVAPSVGTSGETISATYNSDNDMLCYPLSSNRLANDESNFLDSVANIYLPKMDYRKTPKVSYNWKTNGYILIGYAGGRMDGGSLPLGGTIDITFDGKVLTQVITQLNDVKQTFNDSEGDEIEVNYKNIQITITSDNSDIISGNANFKSLSYWANGEAGGFSKYIYLSDAKASVSNDYLPYIRLGSYVGTEFSTTDPNAHYDEEYKKPTVMPILSDDGDTKQDYLYYYQDRFYDDSQGITHCRADYTLSIPAINFSKIDEPIIAPIKVEVGFYIGFAEDKVVTDCEEGQLKFEYDSVEGVIITMSDKIHGLNYSYTCTNSAVINGTTGFTFPVCYSTHCFQRGLKLYQPHFLEPCTTHSLVNTVVTEKIGYFGTVCSVCEEQGELSNEKMYFNNIDFTKCQYGAHGGKWDTNVQPTTKTMTYEVTAETTENEIYLPKINFSLYKTVKFTVSGNDWSARVGLESGSYAFPYAYRAEPYSGTLMFIINGSQVNASLTCPEGTTQNLVINDPDIISGNQSFSLFMIADQAYKTITLELTALQDTCSHNYVVSTDKIGSEVCSICGDERNYLTTLSEIDFTTYQYGAHGGRWDTYVQPTAKTMMFEVTAGNTENAISMPKINFRSFSSIAFSVTCGSYAIGAGLESQSYILPGSSNDSDPAHTGTLVFALNGNQLTATLTCVETSQVQNVVITDADVISGNSSVCLYMYSVNFAFQTVTIELTSLN